MAVYVTYHRAVLQPGGLPVLGPQIGNRDTLAVSGSAADGTPTTADMFASIYTTEAVCLRVGTAAGSTVVGTEGEVWPAGKDDVRFVPKGTRVSVISVA